MKNIKLSAIFLVFFFSFFTIATGSVHASFFGDIANTFKDIFHIDGANSLTLNSSISLAPNGDLDKNNYISSGDIIRFVYTVKNQTKTSYSFAILKTNLNTKQLNSLRNIQGTSSLNSSNNTIVIPNLQIGKQKQRVISFDARINFFKDKDVFLNTIPELIDINKKIIATSKKQEIVARKMIAGQFQPFTNSKK